MPSPDCNVAVNNSGLLNGRLEVTTLNNSSSGSLGAILDSDSPFRLTTNNLSETESYFHVTGTATLKKGSTFIPRSRDNFGLKKFGDSNQYYVMKAGTGDWVKDDINLATKSPLLELSWSEKSDDNNLVITTIMKKPSEAGISPNAGQAAIEAGVFDFDSDPEEWTPNSNGAFLMGIINSVKSMQTGVGNRLGGLRGGNSGDELLFDHGLWFETIYTSAAQDDRDRVGGFEADTTNLIFGYDCQSGPAVMGFALTIGNTDAQANIRTENHDVKDNLLSIYGSYDFDTWFTEVSFSLGQGKVDGFRLAGDQALTASYDSKVYSSMLYYDIVGDRFASSAQFAGNSSATPFVTMGPEPLQTSWQGSARLTLAGLENNVSLKISCDYLGRKDFDATSLSSKLRFEF